MNYDLRLKYRMWRDRRDHDLNDYRARSSPNAYDEHFLRGRYRLPRAVRRYLRRFLEPMAHRPRFAMAVHALVRVIGKYHTGERNFVQRGCGLGGEGAGFILCRQALAKRFPEDLTENLVRSATRFLIEVGFLERITPKGELVEVRRPKNSKTGLGYFRRGLKATKDALGRIRSPVTMFRLGPDARSLFAKTLRPGEVAGADLAKEPLWKTPSKNSSQDEDVNVEGIHSGSCEFDRCAHDPDDPRFSHHRPSPDMDPRWRDHGHALRKAERDAALAHLEALKANPPVLKIGADLMGRFFGGRR